MQSLVTHLILTTRQRKKKQHLGEWGMKPLFPPGCCPQRQAAGLALSMGRMVLAPSQASSASTAHVAGCIPSPLSLDAHLKLDVKCNGTISGIC